MKIKKLTTLLLLCCALFSFNNLQAQNERDSVGHRFTHLKIEMRADFDLQHEFATNDHPATWDTTDYGFNGKYFNLILGGEFGKGFSYYFRQRVIANKGAVSFFDNTDFLYLQYKINKNWAIRAGKEALACGGFEYDAAPIDVYYYTQYWGSVYCFQLGTSVIFTDNSENHKLTFQVATSPYVHFAGAGNEWKQGLFAYSLLWSGNFPHFKTLYSVNMYERQRGKFVNHINLGNRLEFGFWSWYIDYQNRATNFKNFFQSFSVCTRMDFAIKCTNIFMKAGYEQNLADQPNVFPIKDIMMTPGQRYLFYGAGVEYRPHGSQAVRLHALLYQSHYFPYYQGLKESSKLNAEIGLTWNVDFLRYFQKQLNPQQ